jgi:hypothetical protein
MYCCGGIRLQFKTNSTGNVPNPSLFERGGVSKVENVYINVRV